MALAIAAMLVANAARAQQITNNGVLNFTDHSTAGSATITTNNGATTYFFEYSNGGQAQFITNAGGTVDFSGSGGPSGNGNLTAGSIAGAGDYFLGPHTLTVGGNNLSTLVSGVISDCGTGGNQCVDVGSSDGSLVKTGTGTLTLSGANTYTGDTTVNAGALVVNGQITSDVTINSGATFGGSGTVGDVTVQSGGIIAPGSPVGTLHVDNATFIQARSFRCRSQPAARATRSMPRARQPSMAARSRCWQRAAIMRPRPNTRS